MSHIHLTQYTCESYVTPPPHFLFMPNLTHQMEINPICWFYFTCPSGKASHSIRFLTASVASSRLPTGVWGNISRVSLPIASRYATAVFHRTLVNNLQSRFILVHDKNPASMPISFSLFTTSWSSSAVFHNSLEQSLFSYSNWTSHFRVEI